MQRLPWCRALLLVALALPLLAPPAEAIPAFARKYRVTCTVCHTTAPALNDFGERFAGNGFQFVVGEPPRDTIPTGDRTARGWMRPTIRGTSTGTAARARAPASPRA